MIETADKRQPGVLDLEEHAAVSERAALFGEDVVRLTLLVSDAPSAGTSDVKAFTAA